MGTAVFPPPSYLGPAFISSHRACVDTYVPTRLFANNCPQFENKLFLQQHLPELSLPLSQS